MNPDCISTLGNKLDFIILRFLKALDLYILLYGIISIYYLKWYVIVNEWESWRKDKKWDLKFSVLQQQNTQWHKGRKPLTNFLIFS